MNFLYKTALDFVQLDPKDDVYRFIGRKLKEIIGDSIVLVNSYDKASDSIRVRALEGFREKIKEVLKIIGKDPSTMSFPIKNEEARNAFISGELTKVPGGFYKLTFGQIPKSICHVLEKFLNVGKMYTSGFAKGKELFGNTLIILPKNVELNNREFINTFIKQSAVMLRSKQAEEELKDSEERLKILFDYAPDAYYISDLKGKFIDGNIAAERLIGYKKEELVGKNFLKLKLLSVSDIPKAVKALTKSIIGQPTGPDELILNRRDNSKVIAEISTYPVKIKGKTLVLGLARNITERKKAEEKIQELNKRLNLLLKQRTKELIKEQNYTNYLSEFSPDFQITLDSEGKILGVNRACEEIIGKEREKLIGSFIYEFIPEEVIKKVRDKILKEKKLKNIEITVNVPKKEPLLCDFSGAVFANIEGKDGIYLSGRDITERRRLQQNLKELSENLEKKVSERTKELREAQDQLIQSVKLSIIGELATGVAHEVRNPLAIISLIVQHLESKYADNYQIEKLKAIQRNINRIDKIVYGLLNFSHPPRSNFTYHNVNEILDKSGSILENLPSENIKIIKKYETKLPQDWFNSDCLEQVFLNLIFNAMRAMKNGGELYITTSFDSIRKGIIIKFEDTGIGISEENLKKIFKPFFTTSKEGTGLGLSICQNIINEHKGNISVESKLGKGTIFTIFLPLEKRKEKKQMVDGI